MKIEAAKHDVQSSGTMQVVRASIRAHRKVFDMFENGTYANKPVAILRELTANGVDAHKASGQPNRPVEVVLPTELDPTCRVRDFGTGMSHDFMVGPFMEYSASTKDGEDDSIGGFGIGSKSPFAYVDQYTIRSVHNGILSVYTMFKDEEDMPSIGLQAQTTTDEPNGVEVSFPVEDADMQTFREAAQTALQYFSPLPAITNGKITPPEYTYTGNDWAMRKQAGPLGIIMGGVRYPVVKGSLAWDIQSDKEISPLVDYGLDLTLPIGACGIATSREALQYTAKTNESIRKGLRAILNDVVDTFSTYFDNCASEWDAMKLLMSEVGTTSYNRSARAQLMLSNAKFKGQKLETGFRFEPKDTPDGWRGWIIPAKSDRRGFLCPTPKWEPLTELYTITPGEIETLIVDDLPRSPKSKVNGRIKDFVEGSPQVKRILVVRGLDENDAKDVVRHLRNPTDVVFTSSLPEPAVVSKAKNVRPRVRMFTFTGDNDRYTNTAITNLTPGLSKRGIVTEVPYVDQPVSGIMVTMASFELPPQFHERMATGLIAWNELVYVNVSDAAKIQASFEDFEDVFQRRLKARLAQSQSLPEKIAVSGAPALAKWFNQIRQRHELGKFKMTTDQKTKTAFGQILALYQKYTATMTNEERSLIPFVTAKMPDGLDADKLEAAFMREDEIRTIFLGLNFQDPVHFRILAKFL